MTGFFAKLQALVKLDETDPPGQSSGSSESGVRGNGNSLGSRDRRIVSGAAHADEVVESEVSPRKVRRSRSPKPPRPIYQSWKAWVVIGVVAGAGGISVAAMDTVNRVRQGLPDPQRALTYVRDGTLTIKAEDGTVLQQLGPATREKLAFDQIPPQLIKAFIASEDEKFYEHHGVDYKAIARAAFANVLAGEVVEGASTITQQLARIVFLGQDRTLERKLREALLANKMEEQLTKEQILERYLNLVYLGSSAYGVADAAWIYFSKPVDQLTLPEMAMIAGLAPAPSEYSPLVNLEAATRRRDIVLSRMVDAGYISKAEMDAAIAAPIALKPAQPRKLYSETPYFTSYIQQQLPKYVSADELEVGGLTVETTLNLKWQKLAETTINNAIARYGRGQRFSQAALASVDPRTGEIKALVGGNDFNESQFNRATQAQRQPGSTFKAFVYTTAIASGLSPYKPYVDGKLVIDGYEPQNYSRKHSGRMTMREALINSVNVVAVQVLLDVGFQPVMDVAKRMGIESKLVPAYSMALGSSEVNLLELTSAYGTFPAKGKHVQAHGIVRIRDRFGKVIYEANFKPEQAIDADTAAIMTWMLRGVVTSGTGGNAALPRRPVSGKTGTSESRRDLWFVGFIPQLVTGVWLGNDNNRPTAGASSTAARVWRNFMAEAVEGMSIEQFEELPRLSGRRATVKAQRIRPRRMKLTGATSAEPTDAEETRSRRRRRSQESSEETPRRSVERSVREESTSEESTPRTRSGSSQRESAPVPRDNSPEPAPPANNDSPPATSEPDPPPSRPEPPASPSRFESVPRRAPLPPPPEPAPPPSVPAPAASDSDAP